MNYTEPRKIDFMQSAGDVYDVLADARNDMPRPSVLVLPEMVRSCLRIIRAR